MLIRDRCSLNARFYSSWHPPPAPAGGFLLITIKLLRYVPCEAQQRKLAAKLKDKYVVEEGIPLTAIFSILVSRYSSRGTSIGMCSYHLMRCLRADPAPRKAGSVE